MQALAEDFRLEVPVLREDERYLESWREVQVDMSHHPVFGWATAAQPT